MTAPDFPFAVGDKVRLKGATWNVEVTGLGREWFLGISSRDDDEHMWVKDDAWELVPPTPKRYVVELRPVFRGDRCIATFGNIYNMEVDDHTSLRPVIVEELP